MFSSQQTETVNDEIVFVLIPHLVRSMDITPAQPANHRYQDTSTNVSLRMDQQAPGVTAAAITRTGQPPLTFEPSTPPPTAAEAANQAANQFEQNMQSAGENPPASPRPLRCSFPSLLNKVSTRSAAPSRCRWT